MPVGFMFLGIVLIYELFFELNKIQKLFAFIFCLFTMLGYFINPLDLGNLSVNIILAVAALILTSYFSKDLSKSEKINLLIFGFLVSLFYIFLTLLNSDFILTLNPYPVFVLIMLICVFNLNNLRFVIGFIMFSFLLLNLCNLFVERGLEYINFANVELFNLMLVGIAILVVCKFIISEFKSFKRSDP